MKEHTPQRAGQYGMSDGSDGAHKTLLLSSPNMGQEGRSYVPMQCTRMDHSTKDENHTRGFF